MFRSIIDPTTSATRENLIRLRPSELAALLEVFWNNRVRLGSASPGHPDARSDLLALGPSLTAPAVSQVPGTTNPAGAFEAVITKTSGKWRWDHLIYAYMIENTRIYEIFRRVLHEYLHGEKLGAPSADTQLWLRNTEELFFREAAPFSVFAIGSDIRPDLRASRRNAYQRMFGMDLNHGRDDNSPYPYVKADAANREFVSTFEELLREIWVGIVNLNNNSGVRPTDDSKIQDLTGKLHDMLITRRYNGNLSREEFSFVSAMSWFHLAVEADLPIVKDLKAEAASPEQRLFKIAQQVGLPAHGLSKSYFELADAMSVVLIAIETGLLHAAGAAEAFYKPGAAGPGIPTTLPELMRRIITHWTAISGRDVKAGKVAVAA